MKYDGGCGARLLNDSVLHQARVIIPVRNGGSRWRESAAALRAAVPDPAMVVVIDSSSTDGSDAVAAQQGFELHRIDARTFNHGRTRQEAVEHFCRGKHFAVFLTQDAVVEGRQTLVSILEAFFDSQIGAAYGRQIPHHGAGPFEAHTILYRYGGVSETRCLADAARLGFKAAFLSNSFAAYRIDALAQCGGFPDHLILAEDAYVGMRMLVCGWRLHYCSNAVVRHSHADSIVLEMQRFFDLGVMHVQTPEFILNFGRAEGEGLQFLRSELRYIGREAPWLIPELVARDGAKYLGYRLGRAYLRLPRRMCRRLSFTKQFWNGSGPC
jgi:rhamnosyltransferase